MHRSVRSYDVLEYSSNITVEEVKFQEDDDIEYRDGTLIKSNGTLFFSMINDGSMKEQEKDPLSVIARAQGSFSMKLSGCKIVSHNERRKRAIKGIDDSSSQEETLMAKLDEGNNRTYFA